jgi:uncharacterized protein with PIN domain
MNNIIKGNFNKKRIEYNTDNCASCSKEIEELIHEVKLPHEDRDEIIAFCPKCYREMKDKGYF